MKQFFSIVYGGVFVMMIVAGLYRASRWVANNYTFSVPHVSLPTMNVKMPSFANVANAVGATIAKPTDGTVISGLVRTIRYTASEEEDIINNAVEEMIHSESNYKNVTALAYVVRDLDTHTNVVSHNADKFLPIASVTKLVTAIMARKLISPTERIRITQSIINTYGNTGSFRLGETFEAKDLMYPLLMVSSNDAAEAFAEDYGRDKFILAMNNFVQSIGAYQTFFRDASGLSPENESTANDIAIIVDWIKQNDPTIFKITQTKVKTVRNHTWTNPTHFLNWSNYLGGKNGYTPEANRTSTMMFSVGTTNKPYALVILGSDSRDKDIVSLLSKIKSK